MCKQIPKAWDSFEKCHKLSELESKMFHSDRDQTSRAQFTENIVRVWKLVVKDNSLGLKMIDVGQGPLHIETFRYVSPKNFRLGQKTDFDKSLFVSLKVCAVLCCAVLNYAVESAVDCTDPW